MKTILTFLFAIQLFTTICGQSPGSLSYQAVVRNQKNQLMVNREISMLISIIQGSASGTVVYTESQRTITNVNGLVSLEIGKGVVFLNINWVNGPYFLKTETDPDGGENYTIVGTSQLLSVPYALHANTAERISSATIEPEIHYAGEFLGGGIVFWVNETGTHGLICSMANLDTPKEWSGETEVSYNALAKSDWDGQSNTTIITSRSAVPSIARLCETYTNADYGTGIYNDWYLPSREELNCLRNNIYCVNRALEKDGNDATLVILKDDYWTSTELNEKYVWIYSFIYGYVFYNLKTRVCYVRAIRAF